MKFKKISSILLTCAMVCSLFAGCTKQETKKDESTKTDETKLSLWTVFTGSDGDVLKEIINDYNETNEDGIKVEVDIMDNDTLQSKLPAAISTGTAPSFILVGIEYIQEYVNNESLEDISDFWETTNTNEDNYYENVVAKSYVGDKLYGCLLYTSRCV